MKLLLAILTVIGLFLATGAGPDAQAQNPPGGAKVEGGKESGVTIWILSYERKDKNALADKAFLPKQIQPALDKLKDKGAKKMQFDFKYRHLNVWLEGEKVGGVEDIRAAFPGLELKPIASAHFSDNP
jgi:hypothetical protein